jgi:DNA-binding PadR family transcriptional regulator
MSLKHTILGLLAAEPMTGYDVKKIIQDSPFMYWSGNNNQIYKSLLAMGDEGLVTSRVCHQDALPSKKVYTVTQAGHDKLMAWAATTPEPPEIRNPFLVQLAWADGLGRDGSLVLLEGYERDMKGQVALAKAKSNGFAPNRTPRETALWKLIYENIVAAFEGELKWIDRVRETLSAFDDAVAHDCESDAGDGADGKEEKMKYSIQDKNGQKYVLIGGSGNPVASQLDGVSMIIALAENGTNLLLIENERLSDDFLQLRTGIAGDILQKFATYNIKAAIVIDSERVTGKFKDFLAESRQSKLFRAFATATEAESWLLEGEGGS